MFCFDLSLSVQWSKVSALTQKSPHALSFFGVRVPERRFLNSSFRLIVHILKTSHHWSPKRTGLRSGELFAPRKECWVDRQHFRKVKCRCWLSPRQCTAICSQRFDSCCFRGASNVKPWWTHSRQVVLLTVNLVAVCSSVNTQIHATYVDTSAWPLLMIYALYLQWLKSKHWQERTANGFVMASRLILLSMCTKSP